METDLSTKDLTAKQLEWIGDRIVSLAAFELMVFEGADSKTVFSWMSRMISNRNLDGGDEAERAIGRAFVYQGGYEAAMREARRIVRATDQWRLFVHANKEALEFRTMLAEKYGTTPLPNAPGLDAQDSAR